MKPSQRLLIAFALIAFAMVGTGRAAFHSKTQLCQTMESADRRVDVLRSLYDEKNQLFFSNEGGFQDGGVCWWHSRFTRAASYLAYFSPSKPKPTRDEAERIVRILTWQSAVVEIPGYENLQAFSQDYEKEIQAGLESWQMRNAVRGIMRTINPLRPTFKTHDSHLFETAAAVDAMVNHYHVMPYLMIQYPGVTAHAWLVVGSRAVMGPGIFPRLDRTIGYDLDVVDSNYIGQIRTIRIGQGDLVVSAEGAPVYIDFMIDLDRIQAALKTACGWIPELYPSFESWGTYR